MRPFGWDYPPGVTGSESAISGDYGPCEVCGQNEDNCICPECPVCGAWGDPYCYEHHGLVRTQEQIDSLKKYEAAMEELCNGSDWGE